MKVTNLNSATVLIEDGGVKLLCDPWLVDGEYYGSWFCYPSLKDFDFTALDDVDYIYISHIHPDHLSPLTLKKLNKKIPVIIRDFEAGKFVKNVVENLGFETIELQDNKRFKLKNNLYLTIMGAGYCNPETCNKQFGCSLKGFISETQDHKKNNYAVSQIDTLCVIDNGKRTILNVNDCPYNISKFSLDKVLEKWPNVDLLLHGYTGASAYPHCFENYTKDEIKNIHGPKQNEYYLKMGLEYINHIKPNYNMPFAGTYILGGELAKSIEPIRAYNEIDKAAEFYKNNNTLTKTLLLNNNEFFDLDSFKYSKEYIPVDIKEKNEYIKSISNHVYEWEKDPIPTNEELRELLVKSWDRYNAKRVEYKYKTDTVIHIPFNDKIFEIHNNQSRYDFIEQHEIKDKKFISFDVKPKLLKRILMGPRYAHWNNAEIGCHIKFNRNPDVYERGIHFCMNYFHT